MKTVKLFKWTNYNAIPADSKGFALDANMSSNFVGDVEEIEYTLPEGFEIAESMMGTMEFYDKNGTNCTLCNQGDVPYLVNGSGKKFTLGK